MKVVKQLSLGKSIGSTAHALRLVLESAIADLDISLPQFGILTALCEQDDPISGRGLANYLRLRAQTVAEMLAPLEARGLISRTPSASHGRVIETTITAAGRATRKAALARVRTVERTISRSLGADDVERCIDALARIRAVLDESFAK